MTAGRRRRSHALIGRHTLRDLALGLVLFLAILRLVGAPSEALALSEAAASSASQALQNPATPPAGGMIGEPLAAPARPAGLLVLRAPDRTATVILGLTFSVIFTFNLTLFRHLRRVSASPRPDGRRPRARGPGL